MEFFRCRCPGSGKVMLDGNDLGPNQDASGRLLTKQCEQGLHTVTIIFDDGRKCCPKEITIEIKETDPIAPLEVRFQCE